MDLQAATSSAISAVGRLPTDLRRFAGLERVLGGCLVLTPAILIAADTGPDDIRDSISAYHDVSAPAAFYVPLTVAAMLFFVNGILRNAHAYNWVLGLMLLGVILFDHDDGTSIPHIVFAGAFFGGNVAVMMLFSARKSRLVKVLLVGGIAAAVVLLIFTSLFWAEWVSLAIIAMHYILDSVSWSEYRALRPNETPKLMPSTS